MGEDQRKEVSERRESRVLFEPPEPLFPDDFSGLGRKRRLFAFFAIAILAVITAVALAVTALGSSGGEGESESFQGGISENVTTSETGYDDVEKTAKEDISEDIAENTGNGIFSPEQSDGGGGDIFESEPAVESEIESSGEDVREIVELDLSRVDEGEELVINYSEKSPDIAGLIDRGFVNTEKKGSAAPLVMVIHTHTSEKYLGGEMPSAFDGVAAVGDALNSRLNSLGLTSIHCTVIHDGDGTNAYINARETIETLLRIYPSIKYVIDLHRMSLEANGAIVKTESACADGSAQIRLTVSSSSGEGWQEDLSIALALRRHLNRNGSRVCMPTVISPSRYNSDMSEYYIMADIGAMGNSVAEARAAAVRLAEAMAYVLLQN